MILHLAHSRLYEVATADEPEVLKKRSLDEFEHMAIQHGLTIADGQPGQARAEIAFGRAESVYDYLNHIGIRAVDLEPQDIRPLCGQDMTGDNPVSAAMEQLVLSPDGAEFRREMVGIRVGEVPGVLNRIAAAVWKRNPTVHQTARMHFANDEDARIEEEKRQKMIDGIKAELEAPPTHCKHYFLIANCPYGCGRR